MAIQMSGYNRKLERLKFEFFANMKHPEVFKKMDAGERKAWAEAFRDKMRELKSPFAEMLDYFRTPGSDGQSQVDGEITRDDLDTIAKIPAQKGSQDLLAASKHAWFASGFDIAISSVQEPQIILTPKSGFGGTFSQEPTLDTAKRAGDAVVHTAKNVLPKIGVGITFLVFLYLYLDTRK